MRDAHLVIGIPEPADRVVAIPVGNHVPGAPGAAPRAPKAPAPAPARTASTPVPPPPPRTPARAEVPRVVAKPVSGTVPGATARPRRHGNGHDAGHLASGLQLPAAAQGRPVVRRRSAGGRPVPERARHPLRAMRERRPGPVGLGRRPRRRPCQMKTAAGTAPSPSCSKASTSSWSWCPSRRPARRSTPTSRCWPKAGRPHCGPRHPDIRRRGADPRYRRPAFRGDRRDPPATRSTTRWAAKTTCRGAKDYGWHAPRSTSRRRCGRQGREDVRG